MTHAVFVYGSLRSGEGNNGLLRSSMLVGDAAVYGVLYSLGGFPGLRLDDLAPTWVQGEVWTVDDETLERLDRLEGVSHGFYRRVRVSVELLAGTSAEAWVYEINERHIRGCSRVASGDWSLRHFEVAS